MPHARETQTSSQWTRDAIITSLLRYNDVATSFWRNSGVIIASWFRWEVSADAITRHCAKYQVTLQWRHNERNGVSNHRRLDCLPNRLFKRKHQNSASLAFVWGIHRSPVNSPQKGPVRRKMFPFDGVAMRDVFFQVFLVINDILPFL